MKKSIKTFWGNPKVGLVILSVVPILLFAESDMEYWNVIARDFGLNNSWNGIAINFYTVYDGIPKSYLFPNSAFILYVITVICLNVYYYEKLKRKKS